MQSLQRSPWLALVALANVAFTMTGCGAAAQSGATSQDPGASVAVTVDEALLELARHERQLEALYGPLGRAAPADSGALAPTGGGAFGEDAGPPPAEPAAESEDAEGGADDYDDEKADRLSYDSGGRRCQIACRALSSMRRATDRLCSLAGEQDLRCAQARTRVTVATARVEADCEECEQ